MRSEEPPLCINCSNFFNEIASKRACMLELYLQKEDRGPSIVHQLHNLFDEEYVQKEDRGPSIVNQMHNLFDEDGQDRLHCTDLVLCQGRSCLKNSLQLLAVFDCHDFQRHIQCSSSHHQMVHHHTNPQRNSFCDGKKL